MNAAKLILQYDNFYPLAISKLIELFFRGQEKIKCIGIIYILLENKGSINTEIISQLFWDKFIFFLFDEDYYIQLKTTMILDRFSDFGVIDISHNQNLL